MPLSQGRLVASTLGQVLSELLTASPNTLVRDLAVLSDANAKQVHEWNSTVSIMPVVQCIHHVIAKRASDCPSAEAVCAWDGSLTYTDLEAVASRLATKLMHLGVGPEVLVPLCFEKSVSLTVPRSVLREP
jgi:non-ribosomal peptide synthetase component F